GAEQVTRAHPGPQCGDAHANADRAARCDPVEVRGGYGDPYPFGDGDRGGQVGVDEDGELVAGVADGRDIGIAAVLLQDRAECAKYVVAGAVRVAVVDSLKFINIDDEQAHGCGDHPGIDGTHELVEPAAVAQSGQRIEQQGRLGMGAFNLQLLALAGLAQHGEPITCAVSIASSCWTLSSSRAMEPDSDSRRATSSSRPAGGA